MNQSTNVCFEMRKNKNPKMPTLPPLLGQPDIEGRVVLGVGGPRGGDRDPEGFLGGFCWCGALVSVGRVDVGTEMAG